MLDRAKILKELGRVVITACQQSATEHAELERLWRLIGASRIGEAQIAAQRAPHPYTVIATDGSQVYPDRHTGTSWYVINIATVIIAYGTQKSSVHYASQPSVFAGTGELSTGAINAQRTMMELSAGLAALQKSPKALFLVDGPLTAEFMEPAEQQEYYKILQQCLEHNILLAGYTSVPQSKELVSLLKQDFKQMTDNDLMQLFLLPGNYSPPRALPNNDLTGALQIQFFYFNNGHEIIRMELPAYLIPQIPLIMSMVLDQSIKGMGYPVCLSEAHEQAVIKESDRFYFYQLLNRQLQVERKKLTASYKSMKKRSLPV